ncbi:MAG: UDP-N-acetylglucosamine 1-carboxyvinyltransferase [Bacteroidales bacterium]
MAILKVEGKKKLSGEISPRGAKNEALQVLCAALLTRQEVVFNNIPLVRDVLELIYIIKKLGAEVKETDSHSFSIKMEKFDKKYINSDEYYRDIPRLRGSVMLMAPLLCRLGDAILPKLGGDKIGRRRLDTHFRGLELLGAEFEYDDTLNRYRIWKNNSLQGRYILLEEASVTGTANVLMASVFAKGTTIIYNAACEPYIQQLCTMLNRMGAKISGVASNRLTIEGVDELKGTEHTILPDMIEVGSFIGVAALTNSTIRIKNVRVDMLGCILREFRKLGIRIDIDNDDLIVREQDVYRPQAFIDGSILTIHDAPWPGLSPDLISVMLVVATQAEGSVLFHQRMFESRLYFVDKLIDMGAQVIICDPHRANVIGHGRRVSLKATTLISPDIRAGMALLLAALSADGTSIIKNIEQIERGYENLEERLRALGADIERIEEN